MLQCQLKLSLYLDTIIKDQNIRSQNQPITFPKGKHETKIKAKFSSPSSSSMFYTVRGLTEAFCDKKESS